ncbi:alpha/beta hydrolase, partial [Streptomyces sp. G35A]
PAGPPPSGTDLDVHAGESERTEVSGAPARQRTTDRDREDLAGHGGFPLTQLTQPSPRIGSATPARTSRVPADRLAALPAAAC